MEVVIATVALGIIAKFLEFKLDKHIKKDNYIELNEVKQEQRYSFKNVELI